MESDKEEDKETHLDPQREPFEEKVKAFAHCTDKIDLTCQTVLELSRVRLEMVPGLLSKVRWGLTTLCGNPLLICLPEV